MLKKLFNYAWIKENISMVILIPTALGGIWQILELSVVGTPYIRFFSVSQLVSDGLLLLFVATWIYFVVKITIYDLFKTDFKKKEETNNEQDPSGVTPSATSITTPGYKKPSKQQSLLLATVTLLIGVYVVNLWWPIVVEIRQVHTIALYQIVLLTFGIMILLIILKLIFENLAEAFNWKINPTNKHLPDIFKFIMAIFGMGIIYSSISLIPLLHRSFLISPDMKNQQYLDCKIKKLNPGLKSFHVMYFNDQYIFLNIELNPQKGLKVHDTTKIEVLKFDAFFDQEACNSEPTPMPVNGL